MYESVGNVVMQMRYECVEVRKHRTLASVLHQCPCLQQVLSVRST